MCKSWVPKGLQKERNSGLIGWNHCDLSRTVWVNSSPQNLQNLMVKRKTEVVEEEDFIWQLDKLCEPGQQNDAGKEIQKYWFYYMQCMLSEIKNASLITFDFKFPNNAYNDAKNTYKYIVHKLCSSFFKWKCIWFSILTFRHKLSILLCICNALTNCNIKTPVQN